MRLYSEIELNEQLDRLYLSPKQKSNIRGLISIITEKYSDQIEKMKNDQKTAFIKGMRHFAKAMKKYDQTEGAWTDYFEHTVDTVLNRELAEGGTNENN